MEEKNYFVHESAYVDEGCNIGAGTKIWHFSHLMAHCVIGENCTIGQNVVISSHVILGNNVKVQNNVSVYEGVVCEDNVFLGPSVVFTNILNPRSAISRKDKFVPTLIKLGASIGANATIVCGNTIGAYSLVGAGTVVTREVSAYALVVGNPGVQKGWVSEFGHTLQFDIVNKATCPESGQQYLLDRNAVQRIL